MNYVKKIIIFIFLISGLSQATASVKKIEIAKANSVVDLEGKIEINEKLGRAWVSYYEMSYGDDNGYERSDRLIVPGLLYNRSTKQITYTDEDGIVVCANVRPAQGLFRPLKIKETKKCYVDSESKKVTVDNGFEITKVYQVTLYLYIVK